MVLMINSVEGADNCDTVNTSVVVNDIFYKYICIHSHDFVHRLREICNS